MVALRAKDKGQRQPKQRCDAVGWQAVWFGLIKIDDKTDCGAGARRGMQQANAAGFDHTPEAAWTGGDKLLILHSDLGLIIGDKRSTIGDQLQG